MRYLARISFLGTDFHGFQVQPGKRTVQGTLNEACRAYFGVDCSVTGCSRTDSGVHAREFYVVLDPGQDAPNIPPVAALPAALRPFLPHDLSIRSATEAAPDFHVRHDVKEKEYRYLIDTGNTPDPFRYGRVWFCPCKMLPDAEDRMKTAGEALVGIHDFSSFMASGSKITDPRRTVYSVSVKRQDELITVSVKGDGFLYNMVRIIAGTLLDVGRGKLAPDALPAIVEACDRSAAGPTAPPDGLCLWSVVY